MRPARVWAVAYRDLRQRASGKRWYRLPALALALLVPAAAMPLSGGDDTTAGQATAEVAPREKIAVDGTVPPSLADVFEVTTGTRFFLSEGPPVRVRAPYVPPELRAALDTLPGEVKLEVRRFRPPITLPDRSLLIALLAVSLLTGPLAEALPGERARRTLEVLMSAGISRGELIGGKWLAWTLAASVGALLAAAAACITGVQSVGWWLAGLPLFAGAGVALGLWLVRGVDDVVGGAAAPMRVIPAVSVGMAIVAWSLVPINPLLAAAVPVGGALLLAGNVLQGPVAACVVTAGTGVSVAALLTATGRDLDRLDADAASLGRGAVALSLVAAIAWWLSVAGPGVWVVAGNPNVAPFTNASLAAGGLLLVLCSLTASAREGVLPVARTAGSLIPALLVGVALAFAGRLETGLPAAEWMLPFQERLGAAITGSAAAWPSRGLILLGHTMFFRGTLQRRAGVIPAALVWTVIVCPFDPVLGIVSGLALGIIAERNGTAAAFLAHAVWSAGT